MVYSRREFSEKLLEINEHLNPNRLLKHWKFESVLCATIEAYQAIAYFKYRAQVDAMPEGFSPNHQTIVQQHYNKVLEYVVAHIAYMEFYREELSAAGEDNIIPINSDKVEHLDKEKSFIDYYLDGLEYNGDIRRELNALVGSDIF